MEVSATFTLVASLIGNAPARLESAPHHEACADNEKPARESVGIFGAAMESRAPRSSCRILTPLD